MKTYKLSVLAVGLLAVALASAQTVEDRKAQLDAQIDLLKKEKEKQDARRALAGASAMGLPVVVSITVGTQRVARLQLPNGIVSHYREGEMISPGMVVSSISPKLVFVAVGNGKKRTAFPLDFAGPVAPGAQAQGQSSIPDALLPDAPSVAVPAIEVIPSKPPAAPKVAAALNPAPVVASIPAPAAATPAAPAKAAIPSAQPAVKPAGAPPVPPALVRAGK